MCYLFEMLHQMHDIVWPILKNCSLYQFEASDELTDTGSKVFFFLFVHFE